MSEIPTDIKDIEAARTWLLRHGYSAEMAEEELAKWGGTHDGDIDNEIEDIEAEISRIRGVAATEIGFTFAWEVNPYNL